MEPPLGKYRTSISVARSLAPGNTSRVNTSAEKASDGSESPPAFVDVRILVAASPSVNAARPFLFWVESVRVDLVVVAVLVVVVVVAVVVIVAQR